MFGVCMSQYVSLIPMFVVNFYNIFGVGVYIGERYIKTLFIDVVAVFLGDI
jgi:hypothetical protein